MDFDRLFSFLSEDKEWTKKVAIAAVLILTQIGIIAVFGWAAEIARRVANNEPDPIPQWDPIGEYFISGLKLIGATMVWFFPPALLVICQSSIMLIALQGRNGDSLTGLLTATGLIVYLTVFIYMITAGLIFSPLYVLTAEQTEFKQLIKPAPAWRLVRANIGGFVLTILLSGLLSILLVSVGMVACFVGSFFGGALGFTFLGILIGQATGQARENLNSANGILSEIG